jgi:hypothetical protein
MDPELVEKIDELLARPVPVVDENQASLFGDTPPLTTDDRGE